MSSLPQMSAHGLAVPLEEIVAARRFDRAARPESLTSLSAELRARLTRGWLSEHFMAAVDCIPNELTHSYSPSPLLKGPAQPLIDLLTCGFDFERARRCGNTVHRNGLGTLPFGFLDPSSALECLHDHLRTKRFIHATRAHCEDLLHTLPGQSITVVDAGCGPLPVLAITAALSSPRVSVIAYEAHPTSADIARHVIDRFGLSDQIEVRGANVLHARFSSPVHLIVSETIEAGLLQEDFVRIMAHLSPSLHPSGRTVPEELTLRSGFVRSSDLNTHLVSHGALFCCDPVPHIKDISSVPQYRWKPGTTSDPIRIRFPITADDLQKNPPSPPLVVLETDLLLYRGYCGKARIQLGPGDSVITRPVFLPDKRYCWDRVVSKYDVPDLVGQECAEVEVSYPPGHGRSFAVSLVNRQVVP